MTRSAHSKVLAGQGEPGGDRSWYCGGSGAGGHEMAGGKAHRTVTVHVRHEGGAGLLAHSTRETVRASQPG